MDVLGWVALYLPGRPSEFLQSQTRTYRPAAITIPQHIDSSVSKNKKPDSCNLVTKKEKQN